MRIDIYGDYIDSEAQRTGAEDITPNIFRESISALNEGEDVEIHVNSCGGSVSAGISIANQIRELKSKGHSTVCIIDGVAASIASITAMACDEIRMYPQSFLMIHNPWVFCQGNASELRKEAQTLDAMKNALVSFYRQKFSRSEEVTALKARISELEEEVKTLREEKEKPVEERLAKCQSVFQNKINDFKAELKAKDEELRNCKASVSSLESRLEESTKELHKMTAAFTEKKNALDMLNSGVLRPSSVRVFDKETARQELAKLPMTERNEFYMKHRELIG